MDKKDGRSQAMSVIAAMAGVRDIQIDPLTGITTHSGNGSILEKSCDTTKLSGTMKEKVEKHKAITAEQKKGTVSICNVYRQMMTGIPPETVIPEEVKVEDASAEGITKKIEAPFKDQLLFKEQLSNQDMILANIKKMRR